MTTLESTSVPARVASLDRLRTVLTLLVVVHHAVLAYFLYAPPLGSFDGRLFWAAFPIVDAAKAKGVDLLVLWNDSFFMALLFLLAGLFVGPSLVRKGAAAFCGDRGMRLGVTFLGSAALLAPLAYFPAYWQRAGSGDFRGFVDAWVRLDNWPAGPAWFLWLLLAFSTIVAVWFAAAPRTVIALGTAGAWLRATPARLATAWLVAALAGYLVLALQVSPLHWASWGPFFVQTSRVLLYALYFLLGVALGWPGRGTLEWLAPEGALARRWVAWQVVAGFGFVGFLAAVITAAIKASQGAPSSTWAAVAAVAFAVTGVLTSLSLLATAARRWSVETPVWASLRRNAFGIYLVHYPVVTWLQLAVLRAEWPGLVKALLVTAGAILLSWAVAAGLRRVPGVRRVL